MSDQPFQLSDTAQRKLETQGQAGAQWLADLPDLVQTFEREWGLHVEETLNGGSEGVVLGGVRTDGMPVALKLGMPGHGDLTNEILALRLSAGRGYAELLEHDVGRQALLTERLGPRLDQLGLSIREQIEHLCATLRTSWITVDDPSELVSGEAKARWLHDFVSETWSELGGPCARTVIDIALGYAKEREAAYDPENSVLIHGDSHPENTMQSLGDPNLFKFVDPDGHFCEPAYDLSMTMRHWPDELLAGDALHLGRERCALLHDLTGEDQEAIWQWSFIEYTSTGLFMLQLGIEEEGRMHLEVPIRWAKG